MISSQRGIRIVCAGLNIGSLISEKEIMLGVEICIELEEAGRRSECISGGRQQHKSHHGGKNL